MTESQNKKFGDEVGLCANCVHAQVISSAKGSQFLLCALSQTDPNFPKYPRLPVLRCSGYTPKAAEG